MTRRSGWSQSLDADLSPELFDAVVQRSGTGVVVFDRSLRYVYVNDVAAEMNGLAATDHLDHELRELFPYVAPQAEPLIRQVFETGEAVLSRELVYEVPGRPQRRRTWSATYRRFRSAADQEYVVALFVETTETRQAQRRLTEVIDTLLTFVGICDPDGRLVEANDAALLAAGLDRHDVIGRPFWETPWFSHHPEVKERLRNAVERGRRGASSRYDVALQVAGGRLVTVDFQVVPIVEDDEVTALVASGSDISDRVHERDRLQALASLSGHLNGAVTTDGVAKLVVEHARDVIDAGFVNVALVDDAHSQLHLVQPTMDPDIEQRWTVLPLADGVRTPFHDMLESRRTVYVDRARRATDYPHMVADTDRVGLDTTATVPLVDVSGAVFGGLGVGWTEAIVITPELQARLTLLADLCGRALERARRTEMQDRLVHQLQDEVLRARDWPESLDVAVSYEAAHTELGIGGDWFDVIAVDADETAVVVGDVAGHGIAAAARMTATRATIRDMVLTVDRSDVIPSATRALRYFDSGYVATVVVAWINRATGQLRWQLAGHLPPVLRTPAGDARLLAGTQHPPLGMTSGPQSVPVVDFPPGSTLVLCTDGLVERRGADIDERLEVLRDVVDSAPEPCSAEEMRRHLVVELLDGHTDDDVAIVVVQNPG